MFLDHTQYQRRSIANMLCLFCLWFFTTTGSCSLWQQYLDRSGTERLKRYAINRNVLYLYILADIDRKLSWSKSLRSMMAILPRRLTCFSIDRRQGGVALKSRRLILHTNTHDTSKSSSLSSLASDHTYTQKQRRRPKTPTVRESPCSKRSMVSEIIINGGPHRWARKNKRKLFDHHDCEIRRAAMKAYDLDSPKYCSAYPYKHSCDENWSSFLVH